MKKSRQIVNAPVISIQEGRQVGIVRELIVNPERKAVEFLLVEKEEMKKEGEIMAISFRETVGVGEYAVTVESQNAILDLSKMNVAGRLLENRVALIDAKVITRMGRMRGTITEYLVDPENGSIVCVLLKSQGEGEEEQQIPLEEIITMGQQLVIVEDEPEGQTEIPEQVERESVPAVEEPLKDREEETSKENRKDTVELYEEKQKEYLVGKEIKEELRDETGNLLAQEGTIVTEALFEQVRELGRQKIIELTMLTE